MIQLRRITTNIALAIGSLLVIVLMFLIAEFVVRTTTDVGTLGTERDLFVNNAWADSVGNAPNSTATAFGVEVYTDGFGFRSSNSNNLQTIAERNILFLGDSVAFGVGVPYNKIATTLIENALPDRQVINSAVIGYSVKDYLNVTKLLLEKSIRPIDEIILIFCMNDVSEASAAFIRKAVVHQEMSQPIHRAAVFSIDDDTFEALRNNSIVRQANDLLRAYSSLFVLTRGLLTNPQKRHWEGLQADYRRLTEQQLNGVLAPLTTLAAYSSAKGVRLRVWIVPYAEQMSGRETRLPQDRVIGFLEEQNIQYVDLLSEFLVAEEPSRLFLPYDPVHLSIEGHELLADTILKLLP